MIVLVARSKTAASPASLTTTKAPTCKSPSFHPAQRFNVLAHPRAQQKTSRLYASNTNNDAHDQIFAKFQSIMQKSVAESKPPSESSATPYKRPSNMDEWLAGEEDNDGPAVELQPFNLPPKKSREMRKIMAAEVQELEKEARKVKKGVDPTKDFTQDIRLDSQFVDEIRAGARERRANIKPLEPIAGRIIGRKIEAGRVREGKDHMKAEVEYRQMRQAKEALDAKHYREKKLNPDLVSARQSVSRLSENQRNRINWLNKNKLDEEAGENLLKNPWDRTAHLFPTSQQAVEDMEDFVEYFEELNQTATMRLVNEGIEFEEEMERKELAAKEHKCVVCTKESKARPRDVFSFGTQDPMNIPLLLQFLSPTGRILPRSLTGACRKHQRRMSKLIKRAVHIGLISYKKGFAVHTPFKFRRAFYAPADPNEIIPRKEGAQAILDDMRESEAGEEGEEVEEGEQAQVEEAEEGAMEEGEIEEGEVEEGGVEEGEEFEGDDLDIAEEGQTPAEQLQEELQAERAKIRARARASKVEEIEGAEEMTELQLPEDPEARHTYIRLLSMEDEERHQVLAKVDPADRATWTELLDETRKMKMLYGDTEIWQRTMERYAEETNQGQVEGELAGGEEGEWEGNEEGEMGEEEFIEEEEEQVPKNRTPARRRL